MSELSKQAASRPQGAVESGRATPDEHYSSGVGCLALAGLVLALVGISVGLILVFGVPGR